MNIIFIFGWIVFGIVIFLEIKDRLIRIERKIDNLPQITEKEINNA